MENSPPWAWVRPGKGTSDDWKLRLRALELAQADCHAGKIIESQVLERAASYETYLRGPVTGAAG